MNDAYLKLYMPYCLQKTTDGRYIPLNRYYKPLGVWTDSWVVYEDHPTAREMKGVTADAARKMSCKGSADIDTIQLYKDGCVPTDSAEHWDAYCARLKVLAELTALR